MHKSRGGGLLNWKLAHGLTVAQRTALNKAGPAALPADKIALLILHLDSLYRHIKLLEYIQGIIYWQIDYIGLIV